MGNFQGGGNRGGGFGGGNRGGKPSFQKKSWGGDRGGETTMHKAVCSECNKNCEVPFRPSGDKPVYCKDCFGSKREDGDRGPRKDFGNRAPKRDFNDRPSFRSDAKPEFKPAQTSDNTSKQLADMNIKLDRLLSAIEKMTDTKKVAQVAPAVKATKVVATVKKTVAPKVAKKKVVTKKKK